MTELYKPYIDLSPLKTMYNLFFSFLVQQVEDEIKLLKYQRRLEEELHKPYVDLSLHQTVYKLILDNNHKMSETLRKEFRIPERR